MPEPLDLALAEIRSLLLDADGLVRAIASGHRRGAGVAAPARAELRPVVLKAGLRLQVTRHDGARPYTSNSDWGEPAAAVVDALLAEPFGNWHVQSAGRTVQLRVTKRGEAQVHRGETGDAPSQRSVLVHDRAPEHLLDPADPLYEVIGGTAAKRRQVDAFLRALAAVLGHTTEAGARTTSDRPADAGAPERPLVVADLGCGNAYLTFAAYRYLTRQGIDVRITGVDVREDQRQRNTALAERLGCAQQVRFVAATIADADIGEAPDVVLALHACDTATDEALARAVRWRTRWILAAPCCHHDLAAQLRRAPVRAGQRALLRDGILRERCADVLTDAFRAALLRSRGYRVDVVEFVGSQHTPRNTLLRATLTSTGSDREYRDLAEDWSVTPALARLLDPT